MRPLLSNEQISPSASAQIDAFHSATVKEVAAAITSNEWVVIGMASNPFVRKARHHLEQHGKTFKYLEYGTYLKGWKIRLAIKLWSGWPTFPQVFHQGKLIGGYTDLVKYLP
jgi:glutaredoxin-related protein